jgi:hypothetical protein
MVENGNTHSVHRQFQLNRKNMKINYTKKEYRLLLDMVEIAEWVLHSNRSDPADETKKYSELYQEILSHAKGMGFENLITYDEKLDGYYATTEYEESEYMRYIEEYDDDVFWNALPSRLAVRDLVKQVGNKNYIEMQFEERATKLLEIESIYYKELEDNGIDNLRFENLSVSDMHGLH